MANYPFTVQKSNRKPSQPIAINRNPSEPTGMVNIEVHIEVHIKVHIEVQIEVCIEIHIAHAFQPAFTVVLNPIFFMGLEMEL